MSSSKVMSSDFVSSPFSEDVIFFMIGCRFSSIGSSTGSGSLKVGSSTACVPSRKGLLIKPSMATSTSAMRESWVLIMCLDVWKWLDMGVKPKIT